VLVYLRSHSYELSRQSTSEVISLLIKHGCPDVTDKLVLERCSSLPIAGGGFGDIYEGRLIGDEKVAIKCARLYLRNGSDGCKVLKVCTVLNRLAATLTIYGN
jgi:hypothetical protein